MNTAVFYHTLRCRTSPALTPASCSVALASLSGTPFKKSVCRRGITSTDWYTWPNKSEEEMQSDLHCTTLHRIALHYTALHCIALHDVNTDHFREHDTTPRASEASKNPNNVRNNCNQQHYPHPHREHHDHHHQAISPPPPYNTTTITTMTRQQQHHRHNNNANTTITINIPSPSPITQHGHHHHHKPPTTQRTPP